jgi:hypothetical protein
MARATANNGKVIVVTGGARGIGLATAMADDIAAGVVGSIDVLITPAGQRGAEACFARRQALRRGRSGQAARLEDRARHS